MSSAMQQCPSCGATIHPVAGRCKHCKADVAATRTHSPARMDMADPPRAAQRSRPSRPSRWSSWSGRWPMIALMLAVLAIGVSIGVLIERWRVKRHGQPMQIRHDGTMPHRVPDNMPTPVLPE